MPIENYPESGYWEAETYVAFLDLSGFQKMMEKGIKAKQTLNKFYNMIYHVKRESQFRYSQGNLPEVDAIVVSDCAVLFSRNKNSEGDRIKGLQSILTFIRQTNRDLITSNPPIVTTCSIAYGKFEYKDRFEIKGIEKDFFVGWAYVKAFQDSEYGETKIKPGQCRLLKTNVSFPRKPRRSRGSVFSILKKARKYYYFYWMLDGLDLLDDFEREYKETLGLKDQSKYTRIIEVLRKYANIRR